MPNTSDPGRPAGSMQTGMRAIRGPFVAVSKDAYPWMDEAACLGWHPVAADRNVSEESRRYLEWVDLPTHHAKKICNGTDDLPACPAREGCLKRSLAMQPLPTDGVWGGLSARELRVMAGAEGPLVIKVNAPRDAA